MTEQEMHERLRRWLAAWPDIDYRYEEFTPFSGLLRSSTLALTILDRTNGRAYQIARTTPEGLNPADAAECAALARREMADEAVRTVRLLPALSRVSFAVVREMNHSLLAAVRFSGSAYHAATIDRITEEVTGLSQLETRVLIRLNGALGLPGPMDRLEQEKRGPTGPLVDYLQPPPGEQMRLPDMPPITEGGVWGYGGANDGENEGANAGENDG